MDEQKGPAPFTGSGTTGDQKICNLIAWKNTHTTLLFYYQSVPLLILYHHAKNQFYLLQVQDLLSVPLLLLLIFLLIFSYIQYFKVTTFIL